MGAFGFGRYLVGPLAYFNGDGSVVAFDWSAGAGAGAPPPGAADAAGAEASSTPRGNGSHGHAPRSHRRAA
jgi:hypothetical protein